MQSVLLVINMAKKDYKKGMGNGGMGNREQGTEEKSKHFSGMKFLTTYTYNFTHNIRDRNCI